MSDGYRRYLFKSNILNYDFSQEAILIWDDFCLDAIANFSWGASPSGGGSNDRATTSDVEAGHPGVVLLKTGTSTGRGSIHKGNNSHTFGNANYIFETLVKLDALADVTNDYEVHIGMHGGITGEPGNGVYFDYNRSELAGNWRAGAARATNRDYTDTGVAVEADTWTYLKIIMRGEEACDYYINDELVHTETGSALPTGDVTFSTAGLIINKTAGSTERTLSVDWVRVTADFTTSRKP